MKKSIVFIACCVLLILTLAACQKKYYGEYIELGEKTNSNVTELMDKNDIPYKIENGIIYIPEDAFDDFIFCCS